MEYWGAPQLPIIWLAISSTRTVAPLLKRVVRCGMSGMTSTAEVLRHAGI
jgi:hypothetical protein